MKLITTLFAVGLVACLKPVPVEPKAEVIEVQPDSPAEPSLGRASVWTNPGCNMDAVMDIVTDKCCPKACTTNGYDHEIHKECAVNIIMAANCTTHNFNMNTKKSVCDCNGDAAACPNDENP